MAVDAVSPTGGETKEFQLPVSTYQVVEAKPPASDARFVAANLHPQAEVSAEMPIQPQAVRTVGQPAHRRPGRARSSTKMVAALGVGLGVLSSLAVVAFVLMPGKSSETSYDMGALTSTNTGLKGHLITTWGNRLNYKLTVEPSDPNQLDAFVTAINNPQEPLSLNVQLKDVSGKVLCSTPIVLKYDPLKNLPNVVISEPSTNKAQAKIQEAVQTQAEIDQSLNRARLVAEELSREHGRDIFQPVTGEDGQIASLSAQGTLPCTQKEYQAAASWTFATNFPSIMQPVGPQNPDTSDDPAFGFAPGRNSAKSAEERSAKRKLQLPNSHFSVEADDALVGYQVSTGAVETRSGKTLLVEKRDVVASSLKGVDLPVAIHYRCDQFGACAVAGLNSGIQRAWLER